MVDSIRLSEASRNALIALRRTQQYIDRTDARLATGKKVAEVLDNAPAYFLSETQYDTSSFMLSRKDAIGQGISTLQVTQNGITAARTVMEAVKGLATQALNLSEADAVLLEPDANKLLREYDDILLDSNKDGINLLTDDVGGPQYDGVDDYVRVDNNGGNPIDLGTTNTVNMWMSYEPNAANQSYPLSNNNANGYLIYMAGDDIYYRANGGSSFVVFPNDVGVDDGNLHMMSFVRNGATVTYYRNGVQVGAPQVIPAGAGISTEMTGMSTTQATRRHMGTIPEVDLFSTDLTPAEITELYNGGNILDAPEHSQANNLVAAFRGDLPNGYVDMAGNVPDNYIAAYGNPDIVDASLEYEDHIDIRLSKDTNHLIDNFDLRTVILSLRTVDFTDANIQTTLNQINGALDRIDAAEAYFVSDYGILQNRFSFADQVSNVNLEAGDKLTLADLEEEAANNLSLQTRSQLQINNLSFAAQHENAILQLLQGL